MLRSLPIVLPHLAFPKGGLIHCSKRTWAKCLGWQLGPALLYSGTSSEMGSVCQVRSSIPVPGCQESFNTQEWGRVVGELPKAIGEGSTIQSSLDPNTGSPFQSGSLLGFLPEASFC